MDVDARALATGSRALRSGVRRLRDVAQIRARPSRRWMRRHLPRVSRSAVRAADRARRRWFRHRPPSTPRPLERIVRAYAAAEPRACFVQVGAHDGTQLDPLRIPVLTTEWHGVLVEPVPYVFDRLEERFGGQARLRLVNAAIGPEDGYRPFHYLPESDDTWRWYDALGSFRRDVVVSHTGFVPDIEDRVRTMDVPCLTFDSLCRRNGITALDVVQIDTEGYDLDVLEQIDLDGLAPALVMFEHLHLDTGAKGRAAALLRDHGYSIVADGMDAVALAPRARSAPGVEAAFAAARAAHGTFP